MTAGSGNPWLSFSLGSKAAKEKIERKGAQEDKKGLKGKGKEGSKGRQGCEVMEGICLG